MNAKKDNSVYVDHMLDCIHHIAEYIDNKEQFYSTRLVQDTVVRNLQIMAESSQQVSDEIKQKYPDIPWKAISGFIGFKTLYLIFEELTAYLA